MNIPPLLMNVQLILDAISALEAGEAYIKANVLPESDTRFDCTLRLYMAAWTLKRALSVLPPLEIINNATQPEQLQ